MARRILPPFAAVRAFEAAARHCSFKSAADELGVSQSAISHQVKSLEGFTGVRLFRRRTREVALTREGSAYLSALSAMLDQMATATDRVRNKGATGPLFVRSTPAFAARWLVPRLTAFHTCCPHIEMHLSTSVELVDFANEEVDVDIRFGRQACPGLRIEPLVESARYPVASPKLLSGHPPLRHPDDLRHFTLLHDEVGDNWQGWLDCAGAGRVDPSPGPYFAHCDLVLQAATQGQGVALAYGILAEPALAAGQLVRLFDVALPSTIIYSVATPEAWSDHPKIAAFRDWLVNTAKAERSQTVAESPIRAVRIA